MVRFLLLIIASTIVHRGVFFEVDINNLRSRDLKAYEIAHEFDTVRCENGIMEVYFDEEMVLKYSASYVEDCEKIFFLSWEGMSSIGHLVIRDEVQVPDLGSGDPPFSFWLVIPAFMASVPTSKSFQQVKIKIKIDARALKALKQLYSQKSNYFRH